MKRLINWFNILIKRRKELKRWQRIVTVLAAMITFATTYALILPAITVERDRTEEVAGMYLEQEENRNDLLEENALEFTGVSIAADQENAVTYEYADDDMTAVAVFSTEEEIPEGAELVVNPVDTESEKYTDLSNRASLLLDKEFIYDVTTCSFYDFALICDGVDVTPKTGLVDVQISFLNNTVEHVEDVVFAGRFGRSIDKSSGFVTMSADDMDEVGAAVEAVDTQGADDDLAGSGNQVDVNDELISANPDESPVIELTDSIITTLSLKGNDLSQTDSVVGILAGHVDEEAKAAAAETDAEVPRVDDIQEETSAPEVKTLKVAGKDYTVTLTYDETSEIPEGASLTVSEIAQDTKEYKTYIEKTKKAMGLTEEENLPRFAARFFDIKIMVGDNEFKPESGVSVEITYAEPLAENPETEVSAVHFADKKAKAEVIEANTSEVQDDGAATVEFTAESFSVYGVIYTVDFHWEVNGKTYEFSFPGGGYVSFEALMEMLGVAKDDAKSDSADADTENGETEEKSIEENTESANALTLNEITISEETRYFVADVEKVEFSNPDLIWVGKVENETTVGALKKDKKLEVQYSSQLTDEQIEDINAQNVRAGDWALISMLPFDTEESLTVTMKSGETFTVKVTDAMDPLGIDDRTVSLVYLRSSPNNNGSATGYAIDYSGNSLQRDAVSYQKKNGVEYCDPGTKVWLFEYIADKNDPNYGKYYISNGYHSDESTSKYLTLKNDQLQLVTGKSNAEPVSISKVEGTDYYRIGDDTTGYVSYSNNNFSRSATSSNSCNLNFCLTENYGTNASHKATLTSVQEIKPGQDIIVYRRVRQPDYTYKYYAIDGNGDARRVYDNSDSIYWKGDAPVEWEIRELNGYYAFYNPTTKTYLALQQTDSIVMSESDYDGNEQDIRISLPGKVAGTYTSKLSYWYADGNVTNGLRVTEDNNHSSATTSVVQMEESDEFYFAVRDPAVQKELTEVDTLNSDEMGIKITMYDFTGANAPHDNLRYPNNFNGWTPARLTFMNEIMGNDHWAQGEYVPGFVSRVLDADGYPTIVANNNYDFWSSQNAIGHSLKDLFVNDDHTTATTDVNHIFLQNVYDATGYFHYSCFENAAYLNGKNFEVYEQLASSRTDNNTYTRRGNFWPYNKPKPENGNKSNDYDNDLLKYGSAQDPYGTTSGSSNFPRAGEDVYYVNDRSGSNWQDPNCFFGMIVEAKFTQNENGISDRGDPMTFSFNGDDDLWVYADKVLLLDLGGVHDAFRGRINFYNGEITVTSPTKYATSGGDQTDTFQDYGEIVERTYIKEQYYQAGKLPDGSDWPTENGVKLKKSPLIDKFFTDGGVSTDGKLIGTYKDFSTHDLKMFYMERGAGASQLEMTFNLPVLKESSFRVKKELPETATNQVVQDEYANVPFYYEVYKGTDTNNNGQIDANELTKCKRSDFIDSQTSKMTAKYDDAKHTDLLWATENSNETKFVLRPGQTAIFPAENSVNDKVYWYVVEVERDSSSTSLNQYEVTNSDPDKTIDGDPNDPTIEDTNNPGTYTGKYTNGKYTRYLKSDVKTIKERNIVTYCNYPDDSLVNELQIKKRITGRPYTDDTLNVFEYRILLEDTDGKMFVYREGDYYQTDKDGNYVYFDTYVDGSGKTVTDRKLAVKEVHNGKIQYKYTYYTNASTTKDEWYDEPKPTEKTSPKGSLGNILDGDTITIKGLLEGTRFYVYERTSGYSNMAESETPVEDKYIVDGVPTVSDADSWTADEIESFDAELEACGEIASFTVSDYEKDHAAKGTIQHHEQVHHQNAKVLIKNKPRVVFDFSVNKNWDGIEGNDESLANSSIKVTLGRYALKKEAGTLTIKKTGVPDGADFHAKYTVRKVGSNDERIVYYTQDMAGSNGVTISVDPGTYTVTEEVLHQDNIGYTWTHTYELAEGQTYSEGTANTVTSSNNIIITSNEISDETSDTVIFKCEPEPTMNTGNLRVKSTLIDGGSGIDFSDVYYIVYAGDENSTTRATDPNGKKIPVISYNEAKGADGYLIRGLKAGEYTVKEIGVPENYGKYPLVSRTPANKWSITTMVYADQPGLAEFTNSYAIPVTITVRWRANNNGGWTELLKSENEYFVGDTIVLSYYRQTHNNNMQLWVNDTQIPLSVGPYVSGTPQPETKNIELDTGNVIISFNNDQWGDMNPNSGRRVSIAPASRSRSAKNSSGATPTLKSAGRMRLQPGNGTTAFGNSRNSDADGYGTVPTPPEGYKYVEDTNFKVEYPADSGTMVDYFVTLDQDGSWSWDSITENAELPAVDEDGNTYYYYIKSVEEINMPGHTSCTVKLDGDDKYLVGEDLHNEQPLEITNTVLTEIATLTVRKTVTGDYTVGEDDVFPITIKNGDQYLNLSGELVDEDPHLTIKANQTLTFTSIPVGTYIVEEGTAGRSGYSLTTSYTYKNNGQDTQTGNVVLQTDDSGSVEIVNRYAKVELTIIKIDETTRQLNEQTILPDAVFRLHKYTVPSDSTTGSYTVYPNATESDKTTGVDGSLKYEYLPDGRYRLDEVQRPSGYIAENKMEIYFTIENGVITWTDSAGEAIESQDLVSYAPELKTFTVGNKPGAELPHTGGPGTMLIYLLGGMLTLGAGMLLMRRRTI